MNVTSSESTVALDLIVKFMRLLSLLFNTKIAYQDLVFSFNRISNIYNQYHICYIRTEYSYFFVFCFGESFPIILNCIIKLLLHIRGVFTSLNLYINETILNDFYDKNLQRSITVNLISLRIYKKKYLLEE